MQYMIGREEGKGIHNRKRRRKRNTVPDRNRRRKRNTSCKEGKLVISILLPCFPYIFICMLMEQSVSRLEVEDNTYTFPFQPLKGWYSEIYTGIRPSLSHSSP